MIENIPQEGKEPAQPLVVPLFFPLKERRL